MFEPGKCQSAICSLYKAECSKHNACIFHADQVNGVGERHAVGINVLEAHGQLVTWQWIGTKAIFSSFLYISGTMEQVMWNERVQQLYRQSITDRSGENTSLVRIWWACHILIPLPILFRFWETLTAGVSDSDSEIGSAPYYHSLLFITPIHSLWMTTGRPLQVNPLRTAFL